MPLSPELDKNVRKSFDDFIANGTEIVDDMTRHGIHNVANSSYLSRYKALRLGTSSLIRMVLGSSERGAALQAEIAHLSDYVNSVELLVGILTALQHDYVNGYNQDLEEAILANVSRDYLLQAEALLGEGIPGQNDHVPAAVLCGAVLEDALRRLCQKQTPPIDIVKVNGDKKTLEPLIQDLQGAKVFNKLVADQLRAWAKIRNYAAHGEFCEFTREQVNLMLLGVKQFLAVHM